jgi:hypothetical protein
MTKEQLLKAIDDFFSDTSRSQSQTWNDLQDAISHAQMLCESLPDPDDVDAG